MCNNTGILYIFKIQSHEPVRPTAMETEGKKINQAEAFKPILGNILRSHGGGGGDGCFSRAPEFDSYHPHGDSQLSKTSVPEDMTPSSDL
jgi:hypothetical protein